MSNMISVASGFQYSVNIGYDLNNDDKLRNFIPTKSSLDLLEDILRSTSPMSTDRARILIGAYGKGKSHIILAILSMLLKRDRSLFVQLMNKARDNERLMHAINQYYDSKQRILPVIISGSNTSLTQAFLLALQRTLSQNDMLDIMPETNYKAALAVIQRWQKDYPETYAKMLSLIGMPIEKFESGLADYDSNAYETFERIYPELTAGSIFNPFLGFDVVELYENAVKGLRSKGYTGIYVVYDEFSKYLEANITEASVSDTKMLQDFAEKCNRSGDMQMHIMLISHKEVSNYIDKLPKKKVDGWRGVSERFKHIHLNNNFAQTYEIIGSVIRKNARWERFVLEYEPAFADLQQRYIKHPLFSDMDTEDFVLSLKQCYPLHPVSTYILPRLSERVAQNERTLFTFLSADGNSTLKSFLDSYDDDRFETIAPHLIYDYFEPLFRKEAYEGNIHKTFLLTTAILSQLDNASLESKIVKTISLIYILEQYEKLKPTTDEVIGIYRISYDTEEIKQAIATLVEQKYLMYRKRSNNYLQLKQSSGVNILEKIHDVVESQRRRVTIKDTLNAANFDSYVYPSQYNDEHDMTRFFAFDFIDDVEFCERSDWGSMAIANEADGHIFGIIPSEQHPIDELVAKAIEYSRLTQQAIFVVPNRYEDIEEAIREFNAVTMLRDEAVGDKLLFDEYEVRYEDLYEVITKYISVFTHPENQQATYVHNGRIKHIFRKAALTKLTSDICDTVFPMTPVISNEVINRNDPTSIACNSRTRIVSALLRTELEPYLGLTGTGQEVSIMRSTLIRTGILEQRQEGTVLNLQPSDDKLAFVLGKIDTFVLHARHTEKLAFSELYDTLTGPSDGIGLRKGLIPIFLATVLHEYKQHIVLSNNSGQVPINADVLNLINANPAGYYISHLDWDADKEKAVQNIASIFSDYIVDAERNTSAYDYVANAMRRWYMGLPRYVKESRVDPYGNKIDKRFLNMLRELRSNESNYNLLFRRLPKAFDYQDFSTGLSENIERAYAYFNNFMHLLLTRLSEMTRDVFSVADPNKTARETLSSVIRDWCESLPPDAFEQLYPDGTERMLGLFKTITYDDTTMLQRIAKLATGLRVEDWDSTTIDSYHTLLCRYKATAESYVSVKSTVVEKMTEGSDYQITFTDDNGNSITKKFDKVERGKRSQLLFNQISSALRSMGQAITEQEKRQVLMEILEQLCR